MEKSQIDLACENFGTFSIRYLLAKFLAKFMSRGRRAADKGQTEVAARAVRSKLDQQQILPIFLTQI